MEHTNEAPDGQATDRTGDPPGKMLAAWHADMRAGLLDAAEDVGLILAAEHDVRDCKRDVNVDVGQRAAAAVNGLHVLLRELDELVARLERGAVPGVGVQS